MNSSFFLLGSSILWELLGFWPDISIKHSIIIDCSSCFINKVVQIYHIIGAHSTSDCYFSLSDTCCWIFLGSCSPNINVLSVHKSGDLEDSFSWKIINLTKRKRTKSCPYITEKKRLFEQNFLVGTDVCFFVLKTLNKIFRTFGVVIWSIPKSATALFNNLVRSDQKQGFTSFIACLVNEGLSRPVLF